MIHKFIFMNHKQIFSIVNFGFDNSKNYWFLSKSGNVCKYNPKEKIIASFFMPTKLNSIKKIKTDTQICIRRDCIKRFFYTI